MDNNYNKLVNNLEKLNLSTIKSNLDFYIDRYNSKELSFVDTLYELTSLEIKFKKERSDRAVITVAHFPFVKRFEDFDFSFQPEINKDEILDLKYLRFLDNYENLLFIGMPGVGKTHLSVSVGIEAAISGKSTYFISCNDLCLQLKKAKLENRLEQRLKHFSSYGLLIIDEVGYLPMDIEASNLLFQLISKRYEKKSTIVTSNKPLNKWHEIFGDAVLANAILDRLLHHSKVFTINGPSYRTKDYLINNDCTS